MINPATFRRCAALAMAAALLVLAQQGPDSDAGGARFTAETALMEVEVRVKDGDGQPVPGLTKEDFAITENGEPQTIATIEYVAEPTQEAAIRLPATPTAEQTARTQEAASRRATRVLIVSHVGPGEVSRVRRAIREFIEKQLAPGVLVSLDGAAFTDDKQRLLDLLEGKISASELPGRPFRADVRTGTDFSKQDQSQRQEAGFGATKEGFSNVLQDQEGRSHLFRYVDLIKGLRAYPGKKVLVLFSSGLKLGYSQHQGKLMEDGLYNQRGMFVNLDSSDLMRRLRAEAMRARIQLYVVDARGLDALDRKGTAAYSALAVEDQFATAVPTEDQLKAARMLPGMLSQTAGLGEDSHLSRQGLLMLAEQTDGKAVLNTNDLGTVFDLVNDDLRGYYLVGYYPPDRPEGAFRKIEVQVEKPGLKVSYREGFYDEGTLEGFIDRQQREVATRAAGETASATTDKAPKAALKAYREALDAIQGRPVDFEKALEHLELAEKVYPEFAVAWNLTGYLESVRGNAGDAQAAFEKAIAADGAYESPKRHLMRLLASRQEWEQAEAAARALLQLRAGDGEAQYYLAVTQFNQAKYDGAAQTVTAALDGGHGRDYPALLRLKGDMLGSQGEFPGAADAYREFLAAAPDSPLAGTLRAQVAAWETNAKVRRIEEQVGTGNWPAVVESATALLASVPDSTAARFFLALGQFNLGALAEAEKLIRDTTNAADAGQFPEARYVLGSILAEQGKLEEAGEEYQRFLALQPESALAAEVRETLADWEALLQPD